jgi:CheY-like chemotaxis protein
MNLMTNASDAIGDRAGVISVNTRAVQLTADDVAARPVDGGELAPGPYVVLQVSDTGAGMDEATRARIFEPFFTTKLAGRGLGLAALIGIVGSHRGAVTVETEVRRGTAFTIYLPARPLQAAEEASPPEAVPAEASPRQRRGAILVVDDEEAVRSFASLLLARHGYPVLTAIDGVHALEVVDRSGAEIAAVVLDLKMPRLGGAETLTELRRRYPELPVILSSGFNDPGAADGASVGHRAAFVQKPYRPDELLDAVRAAVSGDEPDPPAPH